ncbi:hypothetical protein M8J77_024379, partial [Diaphorina citri]
MPPKEDPETAELKKELTQLIDKCKEEQAKQADTKLEDVTASMPDAPKVKLMPKKSLKGHINKVNSVHYSGDSRHCVSGSLDGKLIIWDTWTGNKTQVIPLRSAWVMSVAFAQSGNFVACGGMDNMCTVYDLNNRDSTGAAKVIRELLGYEGFLSSCRFIDDTTLLTGSGDMKIVTWNLETGQRIHEVAQAHIGDVVSISLSPDGQYFVTGSVDKSCKLWDFREKKCVQTFFGHEADVNSVCFHPSGLAFATGSEDKTARLFDIRADQQIATYLPPNKNSGFTSCAVSSSGRYIFCGSDDNNVHVWDLLKTTHNGVLSGHENRVTSISLSPNGMALVTSSWDQFVKVWVSNARLSGLDWTWSTTSSNGTQASQHPHWLQLQLAAVKLLDFALNLPAERLPQFQMYRWAFVGSADGSSDTSDFPNHNSEDFVPHVTRIANLMDLRFGPCSASSTALPSNSSIKSLQDLHPFFSHLGL